jgi:dipeptidyl aminopeptidase/acylaminoacyl peptidase
MLKPRPRATALLAILIAAIVASAAPARAESSFVVVPPGSPPAPILAEEDVVKIAQLQAYPLPNLPFSSLSPDGQRALVIVRGGFQLINVADGTSTSVALPPEVTLISFLKLLNNVLARMTWADNSTLVDIAIVPGETADAPPTIALLRLNVDSGDYELLPLPQDIDPITAVLSPNGQRLISPLVADSAAGAASVSVPVTWATPRQPSAVPAFLAEQVAWLPASLRTRAALLADRTSMQLSAAPETYIVYDALSGERRELLTLPAGTEQLSLTWAPDSRNAALTLVNMDDRKIGRENTDGALLTSLVSLDAAGSLPPERNPYLQNNVLHLIDTNSGAIRTLRAADGDGALYFQADWSPDGKTLMVMMSHPGEVAGRPHPVYTLQFNERASFRFHDAASLAELNRLDIPLLSAPVGNSVGHFVAPDELIFETQAGLDRLLVYYNRATGEIRQLSAEHGTYALLGASPLTRQLIYTHESYTAPTALYRQNWDGTGIARLSWQNYELEQADARTMQPVSFTLANGQTRSGMLILPPGVAFPPQNIPLVVWQEGGPTGTMQNLWQATVERPYVLLPNFGFAVLIVPLQGRFGVGAEQFNRLADGTNFGQVDIDEMAEILEQAIGQGWTSRGKIGITGCSYGGYFTMQSIVRHPDLYAAANDQCALVDAVVEWTRGYAALMPWMQGTTPFDADAEYRADSPAYNTGRIQTPLLTFKGDQDFLPTTLSENIYAQLSARGIPARFVKFIGEGHGLQLPENELYAAQEQVRWFQTYLSAGSTAQGQTTSAAQPAKAPADLRNTAFKLSVRQSLAR